MCGAFSCLSTAVLKATDGGVTFGGIVPASSAHGGLAGSSVGAFLPDFSSRLFFRAFLPSFSFRASLPSARELLQTLPNGAVDNRC